MASRRDIAGSALASDACGQPRVRRQGTAARRRRNRVIAVLCCSWLVAGAARAVDLGPGELPAETIASRDRLRTYDSVKKFGAARVGERSFDDAEGIRFGNFLFFPSVGTMVRFDDNIFATAKDRKADLIGQLDPKLRIQTRFPRHGFDLTLGGKIVQYMENEDQNYTDLSASGSAVLHFDHAHTLAMAFQSSLQHEEVTDPGRPLKAGRPVEFQQNRLSAGITRDAGRLYGTFSGTVASWDYKDSVTMSGEHLEQDMRDGEMLKAQLSAGYRFSPGYELRTKLSAARTWNHGSEEFDRDSITYEALAGLKGEFNPLLRWELLGGWGRRDFDRPDLLSINSLLFEGQLTWLVTQRLTLYGTLARGMAEPIETLGTGRVDTRLAAKAELELYHNLVMNLTGEIRESTYFGANRSDLSVSGKLGLDYHMSKNWLFTFAYEYQQRLSNEGDESMTRNRVMVGAKLRF